MPRRLASLIAIGLLAAPASAHAEAWIYTWWCSESCSAQSGYASDHYTEAFATEAECAAAAAQKQTEMAAYDGGGATTCYLEGDGWDFRDDDPAPLVPTTTTEATATPYVAPASTRPPHSLTVGFELSIGASVTEPGGREQTAPIGGGLSATWGLGSRLLQVRVGAGLRVATVRHEALDAGATHADMFLPLTLGLDLEPGLGPRKRWRALFGGAVGAALQFPCGVCTGGGWDRTAAFGFDVRVGFTRYWGAARASGVRFAFGVAIYQFAGDDGGLEILAPPVSLRLELVHRKNDPA